MKFVFMLHFIWPKENFEFMQFYRVIGEVFRHAVVYTVIGEVFAQAVFYRVIVQIFVYFWFLWTTGEFINWWRDKTSCAVDRNYRDFL